MNVSQSKLQGQRLNIVFTGGAMALLGLVAGLFVGGIANVILGAAFGAIVGVIVGVLLVVKYSSSPEIEESG